MVTIVPLYRPGADVKTYSPYSNNLCGCYSCWDHDAGEPQKSIGPHDLHCVCPQCLRDFDRFTLDEAYEMYNERHPVKDTIFVPYTTPPNSPTNKEMHAYNGNHGHQHDNGSASFLRAAARGLHPRAAPIDRTATGFLAGATIPSAGLLYAGFKDMGTPLNELRNQLFGKTKTTYRNIDGEKSKGPWGMDTRFKKMPIPIVQRPHRDPDRTPPSGDQAKQDKWKNPQLGQQQKDPDYDDIFSQKAAEDTFKDQVTAQGGITSPTNQQMHASQGNMDQQSANTNWGAWTDNPYDGGQTQFRYSAGSSNMETRPNPNYRAPTSQPNVPNLPGPSGPSNNDMHSYNGNIKLPRQRPYTKAQAERIAKARVKRKAARKAKKQNKKGVTINNNFGTQAGIKKWAPKGEKRAVAKDNAEKRLAMRYARVIKQPSARACRLGSTGNNPTKLLHGFYELTFSMGAPGFGTNGAIAATDLIVYLSPKMFTYYSNATTYFSPVAIGAAVNAQLAFNNAANTTFMATDFANAAALKNETGASSSSTSVPIARFLAGHVSLICRCPMASTAPPFLYGGLLPGNITNVQGLTVDAATQLNSLTSTQIRVLNSTRNVSGFEVSSVYVPASSNNLDFSPNVCTYAATSIMDNTPIPYVGMTGCPTTANVTVLVSAWYEVQQTTNNMYYGGFAQGPKLSTEDIFDYLPKIVPCQPKAIALGTKGDSSNASTMAQLVSFVRPPPPTEKDKLAELENQMDILKAKFRALKVDVQHDSDFEDEKYFPECEEEHKYNKLSKSTIDLALSLKEKLTPGSVTSKTVRNSLP